MPSHPTEFQGSVIDALREAIESETEHPMTPRQVERVLAGSLINLVRQKSHNLEYP